MNAVTLEKRKRLYPESVLQRQVIRGLYPILHPRAILFHPANERESGLQRKILSGLGVVAGVPDLILLHAGRAYCVELKAGRKQQTPAQAEFEHRCTEAGVPYALCRTLDEVLETVTRWGLLRPGVTID